jgi:hypothetical protein
MFSHAVDDERFWQRVEYRCLGGMQIPTVPREELLLFLCAHGSKHIWERLGWICDIAGLVSSHPLMNWTQVLAQAEAQGSCRMLFLGLTLSRDLGGAELPSEVSVRIRADPAVGALAAQVREWLASDTTSHLGIRERTAFYLGVIDRPADRVRYFSRLLIPTLSDLQVFDWPQMRPSFYYAFRPFRLLAQHGSKALAVLFR